MKNIVEFLYKLPIPIQRFLHRIKNLQDVIKGRTEKQIEAAMLLFADKYNISEDELKRIKTDMTYYYVFGLTKPIEYFLLDFKSKSRKQRVQYMTDIEKDMYCHKYDGHRRFEALMDKWQFFSLMSKYYKRDAMLIDKDTPIDDLKHFAEKHPKFIAKPNKGSFGANTSIIDTSNSTIPSVYNHLIKAECHSWILEELITQTDVMAAFNPDSVNSIRIPTFRTNDGIKIFGCFMRSGRKGSVVDNAGAGGIFMKIDDETGIISSDGYTEKGESYTMHPDSKIQFKGFQIPQWNELKNLAIQCHHELPHHKYIGWDFVLTKDGWVLMEGNWGQYLCQQVSSKEPMKNKFIQLIKN